MLIIIYAILSYWAYCRVNRNKVYIYSDTFYHYGRRIITALFFGWFLIPLALIMTVFRINK